MCKNEAGEVTHSVESQANFCRTSADVLLAAARVVVTRKSAFWLQWEETFQFQVPSGMYL